MRAALKMFLVALACFALAKPAIADHDDDDEERRERAPRTKFENNEASGRLQKHTGTACREDNGSWTLVN